MDIRKYGIAIAIAILTAIFIYATADAIAPKVDYNTCYQNSPYGPKAVVERSTACTDVAADFAAQKTCQEQGFVYESQYNVNGCVEKWVCNSCYKEQEINQQKHSSIIFYVCLLLGLVFIVIGFILPLGSIHEWVGLGFIFGGVIGLFVGTVAYWSDLERWLRPLVIALEIAVVLFIVYKRMGQEARHKVEPTELSPLLRSKRKND